MANDLRQTFIYLDSPPEFQILDRGLFELRSFWLIFRGWTFRLSSRVLVASRFTNRRTLPPKFLIVLIY
jgi:hypothetical protein